MSYNLNMQEAEFQRLVLEMLKNMQGDIQSLRTDMGGVRGEIGGLRGEIGDLRGEIGDLRGEMKEMRGEMRELRTELKNDMAQLRSELKGDMANLRAELKGDIQDLRNDIREDRKKLDAVYDARNAVTMKFGWPCSKSPFAPLSNRGGLLCSKRTRKALLHGKRWGFASFLIAFSTSSVVSFTAVKLL